MCYNDCHFPSNTDPNLTAEKLINNYLLCKDCSVKYNIFEKKLFLITQNNNNVQWYVHILFALCRFWKAIVLRDAVLKQTAVHFAWRKGRENNELMEIEWTLVFKCLCGSNSTTRVYINVQLQDISQGWKSLLSKVNAWDCVRSAVNVRLSDVQDSIN